MINLEQDDARLLIDAVETEKDAAKRTDMLQMLSDYRDQRKAAGLPAFGATPGEKRDTRQRHELIFGAGLDKVDQTLPDAERVQFNELLKRSADPEAVKAKAINQAFVADNWPESAKYIDGNWEAVKKSYAKQVFGVDAEEIPDTKLYGMIAGKLKGEADERAVVGDMLAQVQMEAAKGGNFLESWGKVSKTLQGNAAWNKENNDKYRLAAKKVFDEAALNTSPIRSAITVGQEYYKLAAEGKDAGDAFDAFLHELDRLEPAEQEQALSLAIAGAVDHSAKPRGEEGEAGLIEKTAVQLERTIGAFPASIGRYVGQVVLSNVERSGGADLADVARAKRYEDLKAKITEGLVDAIDPVKSKNRLVNGLYDAIDSVPYMLTASTLIGLPMVLVAIAEDSRRKFVDAGIPAKEAEALAMVSAIPQAAIERLQGSMLLGKLPGAEKWLTKAVTTKLGLAKKFLAVAGIETVQQNAEEALQDITPPMVQEVASWFSDAYPDVNWTKELAQYRQGRVDTFFAMLPMVLVGTGTSSFKDASYGLQYLQNVKVIRASGFTDAAAAEIVDRASTGDLAGAEQLVKDGWTDAAKRPKAAIEVDTAAAAGEVGAMDQANLEADAAAMAELDADMQASYEEAANPMGATAVLLEDGSWEVKDEEGNTVDIASTPEAARELVKLVDEAANLNTETAINDLVDYFNARAETGSTIEVMEQSKPLADKVSAGELTAEEAAHSIRLAVQFGQMEAGATAEDTKVLGENVAQFNAKERIFEDVSRIYYGANPLTLVEEKAEGYLKRRLQDGTLDLSEIDAWREQIDGPQADKSSRALTEWFSKWAQGYIVGNADNAAIPSSFRAFLLKLKQYLGEVMGIAARYAELDAAGKLDKGFKDHLARAVGLDENWLAGRARAEAKAAASQADASQYEGRAALMEIGLPKPSVANGELNTLWDSLNFVQRQALFKGNKSLDQVAELLREDYGFGWVVGPNEVLDLAERVFMRGEKVYGQRQGDGATFSLGQIETPAFKAWFGDSKVVDAEGKPLVVYHGTKAQMEEGFAFDYGRIQGRNEGAGFYFTDSKQVAAGYGTDGMVISAYLSIQNPMRYDHPSFKKGVLKKLITRIAEMEANKQGEDIEDGFLANFGDARTDGLASVIANAVELIAGDATALDQISGIVGSGVQAEIVNRAVVEVTKFDGIMANGFSNLGVGVHGVKQTIYVAFLPEQIKSIGNRGTFDATDPNITHALASERKTREIEQVMRERRVSQRISTGEHKGNAFDPRLQERMKAMMYRVVSLPETVSEALKVIQENGVADVARIAQSETPLVPRSVQVALNAALIEHYNATGEMDAAFEAAERSAELGTELGRAVNAFKLLGNVLDTPAKAQAFFARQANRVKRSYREKQPAIDAAKQTVNDVRKEALKLLQSWLDELNGTVKLSKQAVARVEDLPNVTFSLSAGVRESGLITVVAKMLQESGAKQTTEVLREKYGKRVEEHLPELLIAGQKLINQRLNAKAKKTAKTAKKGDAKAKGEKVAPDAVKASETGMSEDLAEKATEEVTKRLKVRNLETPESVRDAVKNLFKKHGLSVTPEVIDEVFKEKFNIPGLSDAQKVRLGELAKNIASTPEDSAERTDAIITLTDFVNNAMGKVDAIDKAWSVWYSNILSGYNTHIRNTYANAWSLTTELPVSALSVNPVETIGKLRAIFEGGGGGLRLGAKEFIEQLRTGDTSILRSGKNKFRGNDALEHSPFAGGNKNPFNWLKVVKRALTAEDLFGFATAQEIKARMVAWEMADVKGLKGEERMAEIERLLNNTNDQLADFGLRAAGEWDKLTPELQQENEKQSWVARRVAELRINERDALLIERASDFAARAMFNYKPDGIVGIIANSLIDYMGAAGGMKIDSKTDLILKALATSPKLVIPFIRVGANVLNRGIDYSGLGFLGGRGLVKSKLVGSAKSGLRGEAKTVDELHMERARGVLGLAVLGIIGALSNPDDPDALFQVHGGGAGNREKNNALHGPKFQPYSIEIRMKDGSRRYITFQYSPFAIGLAVLGHYHDAVRYKRFDDEERNARFAAAMLGAGHVLLDASFLSNAADFLKLWSSGTESTERALYRFLGRTFNPANAVPFTNLIRNLDSDFDPVKRDRASIVASLYGNMPVVQRVNKPAIDILGDVITNRPFDWLTRAEAAGTPEARIYWAFAAKNATPSNTYYYKGQMDPEQFYDFVKFRGEYIKDTLLENNMAYLKELEGHTDEDAKKFMTNLSTYANDYAKARVGFVPKLRK